MKVCLLVIIQAKLTFGRMADGVDTNGDATLSFAANEISLADTQTA